MRNNKNTITLFATILAVLILIFDSKTAFYGAFQGINLCLYTVVPSLFPLFVLSQYLTSGLSNIKLKALNPIMKLCAIPQGAESIFYIGLLGGYPVGAQCILNAYKNGKLSKSNAQRMLGFCNNAGPAFIFGMMGSLFTKQIVPWLLWGIQIISAIITGIILPEKNKETIVPKENHYTTLPQVINQSVKAMSSVCCWVILFRVLLNFCTKWFLWLLPTSYQVLFTGILELANGCQALRLMTSEPIKFVLSSCFLSFGGFCVYLQTISVSGDLSSKFYIKGKLLQTYFSFVLSMICSVILYHSIQPVVINMIILLMLSSVCIFIMFCKFPKKDVAFIN